MKIEYCPDCGAPLIDDVNEDLTEETDGTVVVNAYPALVCVEACGFSKPIEVFPRIIAQQDEDRLLLLYPNEQGRILDQREKILYPPMHYLSILGRGYWEDYTGDHNVKLLLQEALDSEAADTEPPNLFTFATSELSQDAFLCWLMSWSKEEYRTVDPTLHHVAIEFISAIFAAHDMSVPNINSLEILPQFKSLDILAIINNQYAILIEDKTFTKNHSDQLRRYREAVERKFPKLIQLPIYFKIGDQSHYRSVEAAGYVPFTRKMMLKVLDKGKDIHNAIFLDYYRHLQQLENKVSSFRYRPVSEWGAYAWQGFYQELQKEIEGDWGYVANPSGGFWGFWWNRKPNQKYYFQLEQHKLCVKVVAEEDEDKPKLRNEVMDQFLKRSDEEGLLLKKPARVRSGRTMTVAERYNYLVTDRDGIVDMELTIAELKRF